MPIFFSIFAALFLLLGFSCARQTPGKTTAQKGEENSYYFFARSNLEAYEDKMGASITDLEKTVKSYPESPYLHYLLAQRYAQNKRLDDASLQVGVALKLDPKMVDAKILLAQILESQGEIIKATALFREVVREKPDWEEGYLKLAQSLVYEKKFHEAIRILEDMKRRFPDSLSVDYYIATIYQAYLDQPARALAYFGNILKADPENVKVRHQMAQIYVDQNKMKEALKELLLIEKQAPADLGLQLQIASVYQELGDIQETIVRLENILKSNPDADRIHYYLGLVLEKQGKNDEALAHFAKVPPPSSFFKDARLHEALLYRELKQEETAIHVLEKAIVKDSKIPQFYLLLSLMEEERKNDDKAIDVLKKGVRAVPGDEQLSFNLATSYDRIGKREEAIRLMRKTLGINPKNASALNYIGYTYAEDGKNLDEAEKLVQGALALKPNDGFIVDSLGWVYYQKGEYKKSLATLERAARLLPKEPVIHEHLGDVWLKLGNKQKALHYFKKALEFGKAKENGNREDTERVEGKIKELQN